MDQLKLLLHVNISTWQFWQFWQMLSCWSKHCWILHICDIVVVFWDPRRLPSGAIYLRPGQLILAEAVLLVGEYLGFFLENTCKKVEQKNAWNTQHMLYFRKSGVEGFQIWQSQLPMCQTAFNFNSRLWTDRYNNHGRHKGADCRQTHMAEWEKWSSGDVSGIAVKSGLL